MAMVNIDEQCAHEQPEKHIAEQGEQDSIEAVRQRARGDAAIAFLLTRQKGRNYNAGRCFVQCIANFEAYQQWELWEAPYEQTFWATWDSLEQRATQRQQAKQAQRQPPERIVDIATHRAFIDWTENATNEALLARLRACGQQWECEANETRAALIRRGYTLYGAWPVEITLTLPEHSALDEYAEGAENIETSEGEHSISSDSSCPTPTMLSEEHTE